MTKPRIAIMVLFTVAVGALLAQPSLADLPLILNTLLGTALLAAGASVLNQVLERGSDGLMRRTENRPIPAGRVHAAEALVLGGDRRGAERELAALLRKRPRAAWAWRQRAALRLASGRTGPALEDARRSIALEGRSADGWFLLASAQEAGGNLAAPEWRHPAPTMRAGGVSPPSDGRTRRHYLGGLMPPARIVGCGGGRRTRPATSGRS